MNSVDLSQVPMLDLFRQEAETQTQVLNAGLLALERTPTAAKPLEACMRAAHSIKGAARIVGLPAGVDIAHAMEDCFVSAQQGNLVLGHEQIDALLHGVDLLSRVANPPADDAAWADHAGRVEIDAFLVALHNSAVDRGNGQSGLDSALAESLLIEATAPDVEALAVHDTLKSEDFRREVPARHHENRESPDRALRVTADNLNRLLSLSGESLVESRWLKPFAGSMLRLKRLQRNTGRSLDKLHEELSDLALDEQAQTTLAEVRRLLGECQHMLSDQLAELETFDRRSVNLSQRLYDEALACRMRPFADGTGGYARMVRDLGRSLGKQLRFDIIGETTQIDRDILEKLDAPLGHLLRNAVDHGIESPQQRVAAGKPVEGTITLEARHSAGMLQINIADDGAGVNLDQLRDTIVLRKLANHETASQLSEVELLEFLLLPSFTLRDTVTEISGRGVGLDVVHNLIKQVRGTIHIFNQPGHGTRFQLQLPLTLSVIRSLLVAINDEPYAFPLAYVNRTLELRREQIELLEGHQHFSFEGRQIGLVSAHQILQSGEFAQHGDTVPVVVIGDHGSTYGLVVDRFLGERMLVVQPLDTRLGKIKDIVAGALMEDGTPVLIVDVDDMIRSVEKLISAGQLDKVQHSAAASDADRRKRVLVVDDSLTVRELERKLLSNRGYHVVVAVDGMDGWNALRSEPFDLVITDIDMPRMDGIELVTLIKKDPGLKSLPVMIVSYKDREEDRQRGLEAGADYYFAKASFHDEALLQAVMDLIGAAHA
ncbi:hybrid sensor histidine kinase/response regulator [Undibacterium arcticum]|uniref:histidine kinase n=1 Tax=Undibacterium arcticum TaxID=1762892 RepID=A0ABV7F0B2_9BURK